MVERCPDKTEVDGPIPSTLTNLNLTLCQIFCILKIENLLKNINLMSMKKRLIIFNPSSLNEEEFKEAAQYIKKELIGDEHYLKGKTI